MVTLLCKLKSRPGLALGPLGAPEYESRVNSRSRIPLPIFFCRSDHPEWWSLAEVHGCLDVDSPNPQIQIFRGLGAQRPLQARSFHSTVLGGTPGHMSELGAASGHLVPEISEFTDLDCPRRGTHGPRLVTTTQGDQTCMNRSAEVP